MFVPMQSSTILWYQTTSSRARAQKKCFTKPRYISGVPPGNLYQLSSLQASGHLQGYVGVLGWGIAMHRAPKLS